MKKTLFLLMLPFMITTLMLTFIKAEGQPFISTDTSTVRYDINNTTSIKKYGAIGNGIADDTLAIQKAINSKSKLFFPKGKYKVSNSIYPRSDSVLISDNATIYYTKEHGVNTLRPAFYFKKNIHNVDMLGHWIFEGDSPNSTFDKATARPEDTYVRGIVIKTNCSNIYIENLEGFHFTGGVFEIGTYPGATPSHHIVVDKIKAYNCWNANLSITNGTNIYIKDIETYGCISNPFFAQAGIDIETNVPSDILKNIQIDKILTYNNEVGFQVLTRTQAQKGITVKNIISHHNNDNGISLINATDFTALMTNVYNNSGAGIYIERTFKNISFYKGEVSNNKNHGILAKMDASTIVASSENLTTGLDVYNNHGYGIILSGTDTYPVKKFICSGKIYDDQTEKTQLTGVDVQHNVHDIHITAEVSGNKYYQVRE